MKEFEWYAAWLRANYESFRKRTERNDDSPELHAWACGKAEAFKFALDTFLRECGSDDNPNS